MIISGSIILASFTYKLLKNGDKKHTSLVTLILLIAILIMRCNKPLLYLKFIKPNRSITCHNKATNY